MEKMKKQLGKLVLSNRSIYIALDFVMALIWIVIPYFLQIANVEAFYTRSGETAYIYNVTEHIWCESSLIGRTMNRQHISQMLPECTTSGIFTFISAQYGIIASIACSVLLCISIIILIGKVGKKENNLRVCIRITLVNVLLVLIVLTLQNWRLMPYVYYEYNIGRHFIFIELLICSIYIIRDKFIDHALYCKGTAGHRIN